MKPLSRRHLLGGAAGVAMGLPLLDAMIPGLGGVRRAYADPPVPPRRVIFIHTPDGFEVDRWTVPITGAEAALTPALVASSTLSEFGRPANNILDKCLFLEGVPMKSALDMRNAAQGHPGGTSAVFTGAFAGPGSQYGGAPDRTAGPPQFESVDQIIARQAGASTRFPALYTSVHPADNVVARRVFYSTGQTAISPENDPYRVLSTVFGDLDPAMLAQARQRGEERTFLLDAIRPDYNALRCRLGGADRVRLDQHVAHLDALASRLSASNSGAACMVPTVPTGLNKNDFASAPALSHAMIDLVSFALACDLTRVVGFQLHAPDMDSDGIYSWLGHDMIFHQISHREGATPEDHIQQADRWRAQQIMYLVSKLQSMHEADGSTVFDNTTILWASEIGRGWSHDYAAPVWHIIGGGRGYFRTGRYMKYAGTMDTRHNLLLNHYLQYFGLSTATGVGHPDYARGGVLPGLSA